MSLNNRVYNIEEATKAIIGRIEKLEYAINHLQQEVQTLKEEVLDPTPEKTPSLVDLPKSAWPTDRPGRP